MAPDLPGVREENHDNSITIGLIFLSGTYCIRKTNVPEITKFWDVPLRSFDQHFPRIHAVPPANRMIPTLSQATATSKSIISIYFFLVC